MVILIDNGHGSNTAGKCSPDRTLLEWAWNREIACRVVACLKEKGYDARLVTPEATDITLKERCRRINAVCKEVGSRNVCSISIHVNAAGGDGKWHDARGWSVFVSQNASQRSKDLAGYLHDEAAKVVKCRRPLPTQKYWVKSLAMCRDTNCPAVLTENMFMDNHQDCDWISSEEGKSAVVAIHVQGITDYINAQQ